MTRRLGEKTGVSWCQEHERYETLFAGLSRPEDDPHIPDGDPDRPTPDHHEYMTPEPLDQPKPRHWIQ